ncbi:glycosyltransferase family protein [Algoriphagus marincola]|uniref:hypothetical protein n=1 Tax=Algoriphagus marincola TaxID=264027 RepID=UPI000420DD88|nr:hypothetical protein [Algoriphagus marincola]
MKRGLILYRGPLQRSRLRLIILAYQRVCDEIDFIWLLPNEKYHNKDHKPFEVFIKDFGISQVYIIEAKIFSIFQCRSFVSKIITERKSEFIALVGTSSIFFTPKNSIKKSLWFINGIPEEKLLHSNSFWTKLRIKIFWKSFSLRDYPNRIVTVSDSMGEYLSQIFEASNFFSISSTVPIFEESIELSKKEYLVYSGSGAPWQWLSKLEKIWFHLYSIDPTLRFKVISRDKRVDVLTQKIPKSNFIKVSAKDSKEVFEHLKDCKLGFLIRQNHLVNRVSSPIKFGEYLGASCLVVASNLDWTITKVINEFYCGLLINQDLDELIIAQSVYKYLRNIKEEDYLNSKNAAVQFSLESSVERLSSILKN